MTNDVEVLRRLDTMIAILQLAHFDAIQRAKLELRSDPTNTAILDATADGWVRSGDLQRDVSATAKVSTRTVRGRLQELEAKHAIEQRGTGTAIEFRSTGIL